MDAWGAAELWAGARARDRHGAGDRDRDRHRDRDRDRHQGGDGPPRAAAGQCPGNPVGIGPDWLPVRGLVPRGIKGFPRADWVLAGVSASGSWLPVCVLTSPGPGAPVSSHARVPTSLRARVSVPRSLCPTTPVSRCFAAGLTPSLFSPRKEKKVDNMKPKHPDEQEIPFRLRELIRSREAMKRPDPGKRRAAGGMRS